MARWVVHAALCPTGRGATLGPCALPLADGRPRQSEANVPGPRGAPPRNANSRPRSPARPKQTHTASRAAARAGLRAAPDPCPVTLGAPTPAASAASASQPARPTRAESGRPVSAVPASGRGGRLAPSAGPEELAS